MRLSLAVTAVLILGIELLAPQILSVFHPDQGTMEIAVRNLRIEILGQIFYASFMVYNALPMGAGHTMFCLGVQPAQLHCGPGDPGPDFEPFLWPGGNFLGLRHRAGLLGAPGVPL